MPYGKLDVYWPDGPYQNYWLEKPTVAIGRSTGNDIVLETPSVSRYHIKLTYPGSGPSITVTDLESVNGTYIDGQKLNANEPYTVSGGEEIMVGDVRLIYNPVNDAIKTQPMPRVTVSTVEIKTVESTFRIDIEPPPNAVTPGAHMQALLMITNQSTTTDLYSVEVDGMPRDWVRVDRPSVELEGGESIPVAINFRPLRRPDSRPGDYPVTIRVRSQSQPEQPLEGTIVVAVMPYKGFGMALGTPRIEARTPFVLHLHNQGNGTLALHVRGYSPGSLLKFIIPNPVVTLGPDEKRAVQGYAQPKQPRILGNVVDYRFDLVAHSQDAAGFVAAVEGAVVEKPRLPTWFAGIAGLIGLVAIAACITLAMFLLRPRQAQIEDLRLPPVIRNVAQPITINWRVQNAQRVKLTLFGITPQQPMPTEFRAIDTFTFLGLVSDAARLELEAVGNDGGSERITRDFVVTLPQCQLTQAVRSLKGPGTGYDPASAIAADQFVTPSRRDPNGQWVRLESVNEWVPAQYLACQGFVPGDLAVVSAQEIPPTSTPLPTPTPAPTTTPTVTPSVTPTLTPTTTPGLTPTVSLTATQPPLFF